MVVLLLWSLVLAVVVPPWLVTVLESSCILFMFSSLCVVLREEGCSVGSPLFKAVSSAELFLRFALSTVVEFPFASSLVVSFPLPVVEFPPASSLVVLFPLPVVEFPLASSLVVLFPLPVVLVRLPVDLGCSLLRSSHPAAPPLMMFGRWTILIS